MYRFPSSVTGNGPATVSYTHLDVYKRQDQGRDFESGVFKGLCHLLGIRKTRATPLHPQSDGMVERFNRTLEQHLWKVVDENQTDWDQRIPLFRTSYSHQYTTQQHDSIKIGVWVGDLSSSGLDVRITQLSVTRPTGLLFVIWKPTERS